jgi:predicted aminopeptidase
VLSTLIRKEDPFGFIETLIHESVHATLHLKSLSTLNESLAQFVAEKLTPLYLEKSRGKEAAKEFDLDLKESRRRKALIREAYSDLEILYNSGQDEATQRERKRIRLEKLRGELQWPQSRELNNATLVQFSTYESGAVGFEKLWSFCGGSLGAFLTAISRGEADLRSASEGDLDAALERLQKYCAR